MAVSLLALGAFPSSVRSLLEAVDLTILCMLVTIYTGKAHRRGARAGVTPMIQRVAGFIAVITGQPGKTIFSSQRRGAICRAC
ncbi:MAG: hypothetical protein DHS20C11_21180 [Lysobacteraceae bacterium]|nr:MAG: hypothetical protein DHS20C11_21180 [Xanthomonadaceae bacterium]